ncbi:MAG: lamin tail domain-containing protein [Marinilabiliales bacterium]|nr:lamin tail domain-containing protein [Marinilabiliales bacterium]
MRVLVGPPTISNMTISPQAPSATDEVTVTAKVTDLKGVSEVKLLYKVGSGTFVSVTMTAGSNYTYTGKIPPQAPSSVVQYYVSATNVSDLTGTLPETAPAATAAYTVGAPSIVINEAYSRGAAPELDWIEVYNNSDVAVNISGYKIYDNGGQGGTKPKMEFPAGTTLPARGFYAIVVDDATTAFPTGSSFGLGSGGDEVWLESPQGFVIDNMVIPALAAEQSYGRKPDGSATKFILTVRDEGSLEQ